MLDANIKTQLAAYLERLQQPSELVATRDDSSTAAQIRDFLLEVDASDGPAAGDDASDARWFAPQELVDLPASAGLVETLREWGCL